MLGVKPTPSLFILRLTRNVVLAPIIGQVRRATIIQRHLKLNNCCKVSNAVKAAQFKPEAQISP